MLELALSIWGKRSFDERTSTQYMASLLSISGLCGIMQTELSTNHGLSRVYFGNEFCERLIPPVRELEKIVEGTIAAGISLSVLTPVVSNSQIEMIREVLRVLPQACEVVVNDWGILRLLCREFPDLQPVAGRLLNKVIKDPRLPPQLWDKINPTDYLSPGHLELLKKFGVDRLETDLPPYPRIDCFQPRGMKLSLHVPYSFVTMSRICRIGSLAVDRALKFSPATTCQKECLSYFAEMKRLHPRSTSDLDTFQRGNTIFYKQSLRTSSTIKELAKLGWIDRLVLAGVKNENICSH